MERRLKNLFRVLGVSPRASEPEIAQARRAEALKHHPDKGGDRQRFEDVQAAYEVLSDPAKRASYERERQAWLDQVGAVQCPACGDANRIKTSRGQPVCGSCGADLPEAPPGAKLRERAVEALADVGEHVREHVADLVVDGLDLGFDRIRTRLGIRKRPAGPRGSR